MTGQPIAAIRIQEAILDELERQADVDHVGPFSIDRISGDVFDLDGPVDIQAIAIAVANLVNYR